MVRHYSCHFICQIFSLQFRIFWMEAKWNVHRIWIKIQGSRDHFVYAPSRWGATLHCNVTSRWLGAYTKWSLKMENASVKKNPSGNIVESTRTYLFNECSTGGRGKKKITALTWYTTMKSHEHYSFSKHRELNFHLAICNRWIPCTKGKKAESISM